MVFCAWNIGFTTFSDQWFAAHVVYEPKSVRRFVIRLLQTFPQMSRSQKARFRFAMTPNRLKNAQFCGKIPRSREPIWVYWTGS
jgi:hypothetical protein